MPVNLFGYFSSSHLAADWIAALESVTVALEDVALSAQPFLLNGFAAAFAAAQRFERSAACAARAADLFRVSGDLHGEGAALNSQGLAVARGGDPTRAITYFNAAVDIFDGSGATMGVAIQYTNIGCAQLALGLLDEAAARFESCIALCREHGHRFTEGKALASLAEVERRRGNTATARTNATEALEVTGGVRDRLDEALALGTLGLVLERDGQLEHAFSLWKLSSAILEDIGEPQTAEIARRLKDADA